MTNHPNRKKTPIASLSAETPAKVRAPRKKVIRHNHEAEYPIFISMVHGTFADRNDTQLFCTDADLSGPAKLLPDCEHCQTFIKQYGSLAVIQQGGMQLSAMWNPMVVSATYRPALNAMSDYVRRATITGPFYSAAELWGVRGHLRVVPYEDMLVLEDPEEMMRIKREAFAARAPDESNARLRNIFWSTLVHQD